MPRGKESTLDLRFPTGGMDRRFAYKQQPPFTTPDCLNVRPKGVFEGRERGGTRPGLYKAFYDELGSGNEVRMLATVVKVDVQFHLDVDDFNDGTFGDAWTTPTWLTVKPRILINSTDSLTFLTAEAGVVHEQITELDTGQAYELGIFIVPYNGAFHGNYKIVARMDNSSPDVKTEGIECILTMLEGTNGSYDGKIIEYNGGTPTEHAFTSVGSIGHIEAGWFKVLINSNTITCRWQGNQLVSQAVTAQTGSRFGFALQALEEEGATLIDAFYMQYFDNSNSEPLRNVIVASSNGLLYSEDRPGTITQVTSSLTLTTDFNNIQAAERGLKLYIADVGFPTLKGTDGTRGTGDDKLDAAGVSDWTAEGIDTDDMVVIITNVGGGGIAGTYEITSLAAGELTTTTNWTSGAGTCNYRIERCPKIYDPDADTLTRWVATASKGEVPSGCPLIATYRDRMVLAGQPTNPHVWFMSKQGDPLDWNFSEDADDQKRAVAGTSNDAGQVGEPITALIAHNDDYMVIGCLNSLWVMRGDPAFGGSLDNLSRTVGVSQQGAWTKGPNGEIVFLGRDGLYMLAPGANSFPESISRERLPRELQLLSRFDRAVVTMEYDPVDRGVHIFLVSKRGYNKRHFWFDWETKGFFPMSVPTDLEPWSSVLYKSFDPTTGNKVLFGGRDGFIRAFNNNQPNDESAVIKAHVIYGPIRLGGDSYQDGTVMTIDSTIIGRITWQLFVGPSHEDVTDWPSRFTDDWRSDNNAYTDGDGTIYQRGTQRTARPRAKGNAFILRLDSTTNLERPWTVERIIVKIRRGGRPRLM